MTDRIDIPALPLNRNATGQGVLLAGLALLGLGTVMVYSASATVGAAGEWFLRQEVRHIAYAALSALLMLTLWRIDYRWLYLGRTGYALAVAGLVVALGLSTAVLIPGVGVERNGALRWLRVGSGPYALTFQPSELVKLASVIFLACWLGRPRRDPRRFFRAFLPATAVALLSTGVVIKEDFSVGVVVAMTTVTVLLLAGVRWYYLALLIPPAAGGFYLLVMKDPNRWARITAFLDPWDPAHGTYQVRQALIAIGSGGLWGKGLGNGTLKLGFLPEDSTDFIFSVICEELGYVGAVLVLGLVAVILVLSWRAAARSRDRTGRLLAGGMGMLIVFQALLHVAVNIGAAPPTGTCLPLVSAGGTALLLSSVALAVIVSVSARQGPPAGLEELDPSRLPEKDAVA